MSRSRIRRMAALALRTLAAVLVVVAVWFAVIRLTAPHRGIVVVEMTPAQPLPAVSRPQLRIAAFNIAHGRGLDDANYNGETGEVRAARLAAIGDLLRSLDLDAVVLNEVDFDADWSGGVNQARVIAERAGFRFVVEQTSYDFGVPGWRLRFGNAILSRHPVADARRLDQPAHGWWEALMTGRKRAVAATIRPPGREPFRLIGVHLDHRLEATRIESAETLVRVVAGSGLPTVIAGDLNSTFASFPDAEAVDGRTALELLLADARLRAAEAIEPTAEHFTYRTDRPSVVIDWVLVSEGLRLAEHRVVPTDLSDHRVVMGVIVRE